MKKTLLGVGLLLAAVYLLFGHSLPLPDLGISFWSLLFILGFGCLAIQALLRRKWGETYVFSIITFILLNNQFEWLEVGTGTIVLASVLAGLGGNLLLSSKQIAITIKGKPLHYYTKGKSSSTTLSGDSDTVFGSATRYINGEIGDVSGDVVFASTMLYFDNAQLPTGYATYSGDVVFSSVKLYVPQDWRVEFIGDRVFSNVKMQPQSASSSKVLTITGDLVFSSLEIIYI